ncbi:MAG: hypothetical protein IH852_05385 [Bacteroidetes bacterium]|nr:hypothetical protein [Bacteroidota bacterium]
MRNSAFTFLGCIFGIMIFTGITQAQTQTSSMVYEDQWFDLETGTIIEQTAAADFQFNFDASSTPHAVIVQNTMEDVGLAYSNLS